ncbi:MAG: hypothetical protein Q7T08_08750, partial [Devosia sp.]|nr:hypothetical protein [Devosia sp.]
MGLLRADLQALGNLPFSAAGRRAALGILIGLCLLGLMSWWVAQELVARPDLLAMLAQQGNDSLRSLLGTGLMPCSVAATWIGLALAQRQLFETPELGLWRQAPLSPWRSGAQILLRACFVAMLWATALAGPFVLTLLGHSPAPPLAYALVPLALLLGTVPLICMLLAVQIVLVRFFAGRILQLVFTIVAALVSVGFSAWLLVGLFTPGRTRLLELTTTAATPRQLPWGIDTGAAMLAAAARGEPLAQPLLDAAYWVVFAAATFWFAARLHPRAVERHQLAEPPLLRRARSSWPSTIPATIRKKEFAQVVQQPGALVGFLIFALLVFALARQPKLFGGILDERLLPTDVRHLGTMLVQWFVAVLLVLYQHMGRLAMWDGAQWSLYMGAPGAPGAILRGKLQAVGLFLLWPFVLVGAAGAQMLGASGTTLLVFAGIALPGTLVALGVLAVVGTWPRLMRPDEGGQIAQGGRSFLAAILLVLLFEVAVSPAMVGWILMSARAHPHGLRPADAEAAAGWVVGGAWLYG